MFFKGYCGADIKALCTEAALHAVKRQYPEIYLSSEKLLLDPANIHLTRRDFGVALNCIVPAAHRAAPTSSGHPLTPLLAPLLTEHVQKVAKLAQKVLGINTFATRSHVKKSEEVNVSGTVLFLDEETDEEQNDNHSLSNLDSSRLKKK